MELFRQQQAVVAAQSYQNHYLRNSTSTVHNKDVPVESVNQTVPKERLRRAVAT